MKAKLLIIAFFSIATINSTAQELEVFEKIENKTWFDNDGFAGTSFIFYRTTNGLFKAIRQIHGSGVPVIGSEIYDVEIRDDTLFLFNGLNLKTAENTSNYQLYFDIKSGQLSNNDEPLKIFYDKPILFAWNDNVDVFAQIDLRLLKQLHIGKKEIYKEEDLIKIQTDNFNILEPNEGQSNLWPPVIIRIFDDFFLVEKPMEYINPEWIKEVVVIKKGKPGAPFPLNGGFVLITPEKKHLNNIWLLINSMPSTKKVNLDLK